MTDERQRDFLPLLLVLLYVWMKWVRVSRKKATLLRRRRLCLSAGPDTGGSSSSLQIEPLKNTFSLKHTEWDMQKKKGGGGGWGARGARMPPLYLLEAGSSAASGSTCGNLGRSRRRRAAGPEWKEGETLAPRLFRRLVPGHRCKDELV